MMFCQAKAVSLILKRKIADTQSRIHTNKAASYLTDRLLGLTLTSLTVLYPSFPTE